MARRLTTPASSAPGARLPSPTSTMGLSGELITAVSAWRSAQIHSPQTLVRMSETVERFARRLRAVGVASFAAVTPAHAAGFVTAPLATGRSPEVATQHTRRTAVRTLYRTLRFLGHCTGDPTLDIKLPSRGLLAARPLTDDEVALCRASAQMTRGPWASMRAVAWALGETGAVSSEITAISIGHLDRTDSPRVVRLPGTHRHEARSGTLTEWGAQVVTARVRDLRAHGATEETLLAYGGQAPPGGAKAQASVCNALRAVLDAAGLADEADVRPASLRHWTGRTAYAAGMPIEQVARLLGHRSLDATAEDIALDWRTIAAPTTGPEAGVAR